MPFPPSPTPASPLAPNAPHSSGGTGTSDEPDRTELFLDDAFDRAVEVLQRGDRPSPDTLALGRPDLRAQVEELIGAAARVVAREPAVRPVLREVPGYRLIGELGRGGMGVVHRAQQISVANREVALKVLPAGALGGGVARFTQESRAIARLKHPSIIAIHDVIASADGPAAIAMELIDGPSLSRLIARLSVREDPSDEASGSGRSASASGKRSASAPALMERVRGILGTPPDDTGAAPVLGASYPVFVCRLGAALARALDAVHRSGLVHRDVKPGNVLLRRDGTPVLTDFGLARDLSSAPDATMHTQTGAFVGTAAYAPPEQVRGEHDRVDARSDVYSLGATLFHALSLRPMPAQSATEALRYFERGQSLPPLRKIDPRLPRDLETIVAKATDPEPGRRYQCAPEFADDLERVLTLRPIRARRVGVFGRAWRAVRRNRASVVGAISGGSVVLLIAIAALAYAVFVPRRVQAHVVEARLTLLDPVFIDRMGAAIAGPVSGPEALEDPPAPPGFETAIKEFDAALRLAPWRKDLRLERDAVVSASLALRMQRALDPEDVSALLHARAPTTVNYLLSLVRADASSLKGTLPKGGDASPEDLRAAGLIGFLVNDVESAYTAWEKLAENSKPDGFVEAALGEIDLQRRDWASMYTRMYEAVAEFPDAAFLTVQLADAAVHVGRVSDAARLLALARSQPRQDPNATDQRAWAGYFAATGQDDKAVKFFEDFRHAHKAPAAREAYGRYLMSRGRFRDATVVFQELCTIRDQPRFRRLFLESCRTWLAAAHPAEVAAARAGTLAGMYRSECAMAMYHVAEAEAGSLPPAKPPLETVLARSTSDGTLPPAMEWLTKQMDERCGADLKPR